MNRYVSFDLEISTSIPEGAKDWNALRPFGISCAATLTVPDGEIRLWRGADLGYHNERLPDKMSPDEVGDLVDYLIDMSAQGDPPLAWNGASFDFQCLADETNSAWFSDIVALVLDEIDPGFQMVCELGYMCGLQAACDGMDVEGKMESVGGARAPEMWAMDRGNQELVLDYVRQDVVATANVYEAILDRGYLTWITKKGYEKTWRPKFTRDTLEGDPRMLTVMECLLHLPKLKNPWKTREEMIAWTHG